jgi:hypothetical protein
MHENLFLKLLSEKVRNAIEFTTKRLGTLILLTEHINFCLIHQFMPFLSNLHRGGGRAPPWTKNPAILSSWKFERELKFLTILRQESDRSLNN